MKKFIFLFAILIFSQSAFSQELQGGISYDVNSARQYVQAGQVDYIGPASSLYFNREDAQNCDIIYGYDVNGVPEAFTVRYKDNMKIAYVYEMNNKLLYIDKFDRPSDEFPHRAYKYNPKGKLINTSLSVSKGNKFVFTPSGKLLGRIVDNVGYLGNTNIVVGSQSGY